MIRWLRPNKVPIFHVASMARSGETLLLRCLNSHPRLKVVHNLAADDSPQEDALFHLLRTWEPQHISARHPLVRPLKLSPGQSLILKQGVWEHRFPFQGIVLTRNPIACYASLRVYDGKENGKSPDENWHFNVERLKRWLNDIDPSLLPGFDELGPIEQFALFYNRRMTGLLQCPKPVFRYGDLVANPKTTLSEIAQAFGVPFYPAMLDSHQSYDANSIGHGQNRLDQPINNKSLLKYMEILTPNEFDRLASKVGSVAQQFGYQLQWGTTCVSSQVKDSEPRKIA